MNYMPAGKRSWIRSIKSHMIRISIIGYVLIWGFCLALTAQGQITRLPYADTTSGNYFGTSVALDGKRAIIGASGENSCDLGGGAAYIYELIDSTGYWQEVARLVPSDCEQGLTFGRKVAIEGRVALVAASQEFFGTQRSNAVYVYEENAQGAWIQTARLTGDRDRQREGAIGAAIALDHGRILYTTAGDPTPRNENDGAAYIYELNSQSWELADRLTGTGSVERGVFGGHASLNFDRLAIASSSYFKRATGSVHLFEFDDLNGWSEVALLKGIEGFFISLDLYRDELIVGQSEAGTRESGLATIYERDSVGVWIHTATLEPPTPYRKGAFGTEVALYKDRALVVGYDEQLRLNFNVDRVVYIYARHDGEWQYQGIIDIGEAAFGSSIDLYDNTALIGAATGTGAGKAYVIQIP